MSKSILHISILGDICPDWGFPDSFETKDVELIFGDVLPVIRKSDVIIGNLECPASKKGQKIKKTGPNLRCNPNDLQVLKNAGFTALSCANNHILDYGEEALLDTLLGAKEYGLQTFGAGETIGEAAQPLIIEKSGWRIGFVSFAEEEFNCVTERSAGANKFDPYCSLSNVSEIRKKTDYLIVIYHGGIEEYKYPSPLLQKKCRSMVKAGADLVLCQHSHCIGTQESFEGGNILYGQGNAIFGRHDNDEAWNQGLLVQIELKEEKPAAVSYRVFEAFEKGIRLLSLEAERRRLVQLYNDSKPIANADFVKNEWDAFCESQKAMYLPMLFARGRVFNKLNRLTGNFLINLFAGTKKQRLAMNLIRCDAHREVCQTVLENEVRP